MLKASFFRSRIVFFLLFLIVNALFFLPGNEFPKEDWLDQIFFDKWVHIGLFAALLFLGCSAFGPRREHWGWIIAGAALYGLLVEIVQWLWIPFRSFDLFDIVADTIGSLAGVWLWLRVYKKNKPL